LRADASEKERMKFMDELNKAKALIGLHVSNDLIHLVAEAPGPKEAFDKLKEMFEPKMTSNKLILLRKLLYTHIDESVSPLDHMNKMKTIFNNLKALDNSFSEDLLILSILHSLPPRFDGLVQSFWHSSGKISFETLYSRVQVEEFRVSDRAMIKRPQEGVAFKINSLNSKKKSKGTSQAGPFQKNFPSSKSFKRFNKDEKGLKRNDRSDKICYACRKPGHFAKDCKEQGKDELNSKDEKLHQIEEKFDGIAFSIQEESSTKHWLIDSGASNHCCSEKNNFHTYQEIDPRPMKQSDQSSNQLLKLLELEKSFWQSC